MWLPEVHNQRCIKYRHYMVIYDQFGSYLIKLLDTYIGFKQYINFLVTQ